MKEVAVEYYINFGRLSPSEWIDWHIELTDEEEKIYDNAIVNGIPLKQVVELEVALERAYRKIKKMEIQYHLEGADVDAYIKECEGEVEVDLDAVNELIAERDL